MDLHNQQRRMTVHIPYLILQERSAAAAEEEVTVMPAP